MMSEKTNKEPNKPVVHCQYTSLMDVERVIPNPRNPNRHPPSQLALLGKLLSVHGFRVPITVSKRSGFVVRGHGRLEAARLAGFSVVPIDEQDYASDALEWADMVADNRLSELSELDRVLLKDLLQEIDTGDFDMEFTGFTEEDIEKLMTATMPPSADGQREPDTTDKHVEIDCTDAGFDAIRETLIEWGTLDGVTVHIS